ncbi:CBL-interacting protein kinase 2-like [Impatiens glandulifera]|uniref:CBL-interacting protein kinase 2-like n=1 Tax=Impatiens glandulifera TaxID=253017 RepID=UPI001FB0654F|nr:CBL-interacting protein kinase 2-like [Impatiens glandulifera]
MEKGNVLMKRYDIGRLLGQGNFAKVYYGRDIKSGQSVAIKVIHKEKVLKAGLIEQTMREISIMRLVKHPNILQLYEVMATKTKIYFVMEYAKGGELFKKLCKGRLKEDVARRYFRQLVSAIRFCHSRGVYHRDLKPENILLDENGDLKVSDFGLSALAESKLQDGLLHTTCGTPAYVAPEVIGRKGYDGEKADVWSCGVILFVLLSGYLPFFDSNLIRMYRKICKAEYKSPSWFPPNIRKLLTRILEPNPHIRISFDKIIEHPWFMEGLETKPCDNESKEKEMILPVMTKSTTNTNAFAIISLSMGFDLSGLFIENDNKEEVQFTSKNSPSEIMIKLEEISGNLNFRVVKKDEGLLRLEGNMSGDCLCVDIEIIEFACSFHVVEMKKVKGDVVCFQKFLNGGIRTALKDVVWSWQGELPMVNDGD